MPTHPRKAIRKSDPVPVIPWYISLRLWWSTHWMRTAHAQNFIKRLRGE